MTSRTKTEEYLRSTSLPQQTDTYTVISHGFIIDKIRTMIKAEGFDVKEELYLGEDKGEIGMGFMIINNVSDPDMSMTFNWTNSYNKKLKFSCSVGGFIYDNNVQFIASDESIKWTRKHTGTALEETDLVIETIIKNANEHFSKIIEMKNNYIETKISKKDFGRILGAMYFEKDIISPDIASKIKKEYKRPSQNYTHPNTLWELYKITMAVVKETSPVKWYNQQIKINNQFALEYLLISNKNQLTENTAITNELKQLDGPVEVIEETIVESKQMSLDDIFKSVNIEVEEESVCLPPDTIENVEAAVVVTEVEPDDFIIEEIETVDTELQNDEVITEESTVEDTFEKEIISSVSEVIEDQPVEIVDEEDDDIFPTEDDNEDALETVEELLEIVEEKEEVADEISQEEIQIINDISQVFIPDSLRKDANQFLTKHYKKYSIEDCNINELNSTYVLTIKQTNESFMINK